MDKIIQKRYTFEISFNTYFFNVNKVLDNLKKKYDVISVKRTWSITNPFRMKLQIEVEMKQEINVEEIRNKQHKKIIGSKKYGRSKNDVSNKTE